MGNATQATRRHIDRLLHWAGWHVCDLATADVHAARGGALREIPLGPGHSFTDYLLYVGGKAACVIEARMHGTTLAGVETQPTRYAQGLPATLPSHQWPLPFLYVGPGLETHVTNGLSPALRGRIVFAFQWPEPLVEWQQDIPQATAVTTGAAPASAANTAQFAPAMVFVRVRTMPPLVTESVDHNLWPARLSAIRDLQANVGGNKPRALIQMTIGTDIKPVEIVALVRSAKSPGFFERMRGRVVPVNKPRAVSVPRRRSDHRNRYPPTLSVTLDRPNCLSN